MKGLALEVNFCAVGFQKGRISSINESFLHIALLQVQAKVVPKCWLRLSSPAKEITRL